LSTVTGDLQRERDDLAKADEVILKGERRVSEQLIVIERLALRGEDIAAAEELLANLLANLDQWHVHRAIILERIRQLSKS
jgi:hypothetical protein